MSRRLVPTAAVLAALVAGAAAADPATVQMHERIREVEAAVQRGTADALRLSLQEQARARPSDVMLRVLIAWCAMPSDDAWNQLKGVVSIYPENTWARLGMGRIYIGWKMRDQAEAELRAALKTNARFYPAHVGLGDVARAAEKPAEAEAHYRRALELHADPEAFAGLGHALLSQGKSGEAKEAFAKAVSLLPDQPVVLRELAKLARAAGELAAAGDWTEKRVALTPKDAEARLQLAELLEAAGQKAQAAAEYEQALRLGLTSPELYRKVALLHRELGDAEGERRAVEQLSALERTTFEHPVRLAELAAARGDPEQAEAQLLEALDRAKARSELHVRLARLRVARGDLREALDAYRDAAAGPEEQVAGAQQEAAELAERFRLPKAPASGSVDRIYSKVAGGLNAFYRERIKEVPELAGELSLRVRVAEDGAVRGVDVLKDTLGDPLLTAHAYFALKDAVFPKQRREPVFEFTLQPAKGKR